MANDDKFWNTDVHESHESTQSTCVRYREILFQNQSIIILGPTLNLTHNLRLQK